MIIGKKKQQIYDFTVQIKFGTSIRRFDRKNGKQKVYC